jgi:hypothetical protein
MSKIRMILVGLTAAALIGGVMSADPAMAGKRKKHKKAKIVKIQKVDKSQSVNGGNAGTGNGGNGGHGGHGGSAVNTGGGGGVVFLPGTAPGAGLPAAFAACMAAAALPGSDGGTTINADEFTSCLTSTGTVLAALPAAFLACIGSLNSVNAIPPTQQFCFAGAPGFAATVVATPGALSVGGAGGTGAPSGDARGGVGGTIRNSDNSVRVSTTNN